MRQELLPKANATCKVCGNPYYVCKRCIELRDKGIYGWKLYCDTPQCYQIMIAVENYKNGGLSKASVLDIVNESQKISGIETYTSQYLELIEEIKTPDEQKEVESKPATKAENKPVQVENKPKTYTHNYKNKTGKRHGNK